MAQCDDLKSEEVSARLRRHRERFQENISKISMGVSVLFFKCAEKTPVNPSGEVGKCSADIMMYLMSEKDPFVVGSCKKINLKFS